MPVYIVSQNETPVAVTSGAQKALDFTQLHNNLCCVDIHEAEMDKPPERLILAGKLVYHKNILTGAELWPDKEFIDKLS